MKKTLITREQFKIMPWKNGAGTTAEIDIQPAGSDFRETTFDWRISSAHIADENSFSKFPGYDRILTVLSGEGLILNSQELGPFEVYEFQGEDQVDCSLIENPVEDLNVIFRRDKYECSMQILNVEAPMYLKLEAGTHFFLPLSSSVTIAGVEVKIPDFLKVEESSGGIELTAQIFPAHVLRVGIAALN